jgi:hypothetical protein
VRDIRHGKEGRRRRVEEKGGRETEREGRGEWRERERVEEKGGKVTLRKRGRER